MRSSSTWICGAIQAALLGAPMSEPKGKPRGRKGGRKKLDKTGAYREPWSWSMTKAEYTILAPKWNADLEQLRKQGSNSEWVEG